MSVPNGHWTATTTFCADHGQWPVDVTNTVIYVIRTSPFVRLFCSVFTGVVLQYFIVNATVWWLFHLLSIFYSVMFPFTARRWKKKEKYIHLALLIVGKGHVCMSVESHSTWSVWATSQVFWFHYQEWLLLSPVTTNAMPLPIFLLYSVVLAMKTWYSIPLCSSLTSSLW